MTATTTTKFTRSDYMEQRCTHRQYYGQFVTDQIKAIVARNITIPRLMNSHDAHLNDIPLGHWDAMSHGHKGALSIEEGGKRLYSLAGGVCILKEAAKQIIEENRN